MWDGNFDVSFHLRTMVKDTKLIHRHAEDLGVPVMLSNTVHELNKMARNLGWGELNATAIFKLCELLAGLAPGEGACAGRLKARRMPDLLPATRWATSSRRSPCPPNHTATSVMEEVKETLHLIVDQ